jgi:hypothetical protein
MHVAVTSYAGHRICWKSGVEFTVLAASRSRGTGSTRIGWGHFWGHFFDAHSKIPYSMRVHRHCSIALLPTVHAVHRHQGRTGGCPPLEPSAQKLLRPEPDYAQHIDLEFGVAYARKEDGDLHSLGKPDRTIRLPGGKNGRQGLPFRRCLVPGACTLRAALPHLCQPGTDGPLLFGTCRLTEILRDCHKRLIGYTLTQWYVRQGAGPESCGIPVLR